MSDQRLRIRASRRSGELEVEGPPELVAEWWERLWPELAQKVEPEPIAPVVESPEESRPGTPATSATPATPAMPAHFGEFYSEYRPDITDVDKILVAAAYVQNREVDKCFTTKSANQLLLDQNVKVTNASENVRRLVQSKRAFAVSEGKFRVSNVGFDHLKTLKAV